MHVAVPAHGHARHALGAARDHHVVGAQGDLAHGGVDGGLDGIGVERSDRRGERLDERVDDGLRGDLTGSVTAANTEFCGSILRMALSTAFTVL